MQLLPDPERHSYARAHVQVHERLDGSLAVSYAGRRSAQHVCAPGGPCAAATRWSSEDSAIAVSGPTTQPCPPARAQVTVVAAETKQARKPAHNHPWNKAAVLPKGVYD